MDSCHRNFPLRNSSHFSQAAGHGARDAWHLDAPDLGAHEGQQPGRVGGGGQGLQDLWSFQHFSWEKGWKTSIFNGKTMENHHFEWEKDGTQHFSWKTMVNG